MAEGSRDGLGCPGMAGWVWLKIARDGRKWPGMAGNGQGRWEMARNVWGWPARGWPKTAVECGDGQEWQEMAGNGQGWPKMAVDGGGCRDDHVRAVMWLWVNGDHKNYVIFFTIFLD